MRKWNASLVVVMLGIAVACGGKEPAAPPVEVSAAKIPVPSAEMWRDSFTVDKSTLVTTGRNKYFVLEPGHKLTLEGNEGPISVQVVITVLNDTELVDGVVTRVVEERESKDGKLVEISRNFFAIDPVTNDAYYFGEDVDYYKDGAISGHAGAWRSGVNGARFGLIMPGNATVGQMYYQEIAPGQAMDRGEHKSITEVVETPAGKFENCLKVEETTPLEPGEVSIKLYAPEVGMIGDGSIRLVKKETKK